MNPFTNVRKAKIIEFGKIEEVYTGELMFSNFHVDGADEFNSLAVCLLTLVIERLQSELEKRNLIKFDQI